MAVVEPDPVSLDPAVSPGGGRCPVCGWVLARYVLPELCPKCMLGAGLGDGGMAHPAGRPAARGRFGYYELMRLLGAGGMGEVHEAEDLDTGRRVALEILDQRLDSPTARERFLREGRLAASINHPHSVYVFGTGEIAGIPVIAMELMPGGTLEERVRADGPFEIRAAVDAVLQVVDGLEAARQVGILHRDVKPSNCFLDADGTVKIGDYGLSLPTGACGDARQTAAGSFMGTPAFASPEQLRGDELTWRSDLYAVGVTLFYLLTGKLPHESTDMIRLVAMVLEQPAPSPAGFRPEIPKRLCRAVGRCLEKCPDDRFSSYHELRGELAGFGSGGTQAAGPASRLAAGAVDVAIIGLPVILLCRFLFAGNPRFWVLDMGVVLLVLITALLAAVGCLWLFEWRCGRTPGMSMLGLRVTDGTGRRPGLQASLGRSGLRVLLPAVLALAAFPPVRVEVGANRSTIHLLGHSFPTTTKMVAFRPEFRPMTVLCWVGATLALFATARRRNGYQTIHDLLTGTRVVKLWATEAGPSLQVPAEPEAMLVGPEIGPFHVLGKLAGTDEWLTGFDSRLLRRVWLHLVPAGTPSVSNIVRNVGRPGRLRWLAGRRSAVENWDAYECLAGQSLVKRIANPQPWECLRVWLLDVATELHESENDGSLSREPGLECIWITRDGRAKLMDMPAPGSGTGPGRRTGNILLDLTTHGLDRRPLPLPVSRFLNTLGDGRAAGEIAGELRWLARIPPQVSRRQRLAIVGFGAIVPALAGLAALWPGGWTLPAALAGAAAAMIAGVALPALVAAAVVGEGLLLRAFGLAVVDGDGRPASASRATRRSLIAWLPSLLAPAVAAGIAIWLGTFGATLTAAVVPLTLAFVSALLPDRGIPDRLTGTWLVPA